jgi:peptidoglycan hydrolase-like protein with peptidoglycan-binding domain
VRRVQLGPLAYGYYDGAIDGAVGPKMKDALRRFQTDFNLKVTGTITPEVLDALKVATV